MASSEAYTHAQFGNTSPRSSARILRRASTQKDQKAVEEVDVVQGRILWLPPKEELPDRAVRRAHGKGAVEEGIYNHPIVVISRPADDRHTVHFHLVSNAGPWRERKVLTKTDHIVPRQAAKRDIRQGQRVPRESSLMVPSNSSNAGSPGCHLQEVKEEIPDSGSGWWRNSPVGLLREPEARLPGRLVVPEGVL